MNEELVTDPEAGKSPVSENWLYLQAFCMIFETTGVIPAKAVYMNLFIPTDDPNRQSQYLRLICNSTLYTLINVPLTRMAALAGGDESPSSRV